MSVRDFIAAVSVVISLVSVAAAQQTQNPSSQTGIALEVTYKSDRPPAYQPVPWASAPRGWVWYGNFGRAGRLSAVALPVRAVKVVPFLDEEAVRITVSVLRGEKFQDDEDLVGAYSARENETVMILALKEFGVEPFQIKVVRVAPLVPALPEIVNHTKSLEVVGIEPVVSTLPAYKLTFRSLSDKSVSALRLNVEEGGQNRLSGMPQGKDGEPLIKAGALIELNQMWPTRAQATPGGFAPVPSKAQKIVIASLVFEDGTYEGDAQPAAEYRGFTAGRKTELGRIVPVLENTLAEDVSAKSLRTDLSELRYEVKPSDVEELAIAFPSIERKQLQWLIELSMHGVRRDLLAELERFEQRGYRKESFRSWLTRTKDRYSNWLARMTSQDLTQR